MTCLRVETWPKLSLIHQMTCKSVHFPLLSFGGKCQHWLCRHVNLSPMIVSQNGVSNFVRPRLNSPWDLKPLTNLSHISSAISDFSLIPQMTTFTDAMDTHPQMTGSQGFYWGILRNDMSKRAFAIMTLLWLTLSFGGFVSNFCIWWQNLKVAFTVRGRVPQ